jgi:nicotinamidase-related amidase
MTKPYTRLDKDKAAVLLVDHQTGLLSLVRDIDPDKFKNNVLALADLAKYFKLPTILTTSFEDGNNGPLVPELKQAFAKAPFVPRPGQINAWDNEDFVKAVKATSRMQLIIAGVVTEVCVAFPALSAIAEGYEVFVVTDASGTFTGRRYQPRLRLAISSSVFTVMVAADARQTNSSAFPSASTRAELPGATATFTRAAAGGGSATSSRGASASMRVTLHVPRSLRK